MRSELDRALEPLFSSQLTFCLFLFFLFFDCVVFRHRSSADLEGTQIRHEVGIRGGGRREGKKRQRTKKQGKQRKEGKERKEKKRKERALSDSLNHLDFTPGPPF